MSIKMNFQDFKDKIYSTMEERYSFYVTATVFEKMHNSMGAIVNIFNRNSIDIENYWDEGP